LEDAEVSDPNSNEAETFRRLKLERRAATRRLLVSVDKRTNQVALEGQPDIGYLSILYGDFEGSLVLRVPDLWALHTAWQYLLTGVQYPFLSQKLHPFFGVYFTPKPFEHFLLLTDWLDKHPDELASSSSGALDLGTGSGVVSLILRGRRPDLQVVASDLCPNAVFSARCEVARWGASDIQVVQSDLFANLADQGPFDLIVFNPPWIPRPSYDWESTREEASEALDAAYEVVRGVGDVTGGNDYPPELFDRLFAEAPQHLKPGGRLIVLFSNYAQCRGLTPSSPLQRFASGGRALSLHGVEERVIEAKARSANRVTQQEKAWLFEREHAVELWEFVKDT